ncbi:hypothetical protein EK904_014323 [Melospiza melodia maxima]|nr:hypothetical protein EK904_014323 [Melospiza melodia maxima]
MGGLWCHHHNSGLSRDLLNSLSCAGEPKALSPGCPPCSGCARDKLLEIWRCETGGETRERFAATRGSPYCWEGEEEVIGAQITS